MKILSLIRHYCSLSPKAGLHLNQFWLVPKVLFCCCWKELCLFFSVCPLASILFLTELLRLSFPWQSSRTIVTYIYWFYLPNIMRYFLCGGTAIIDLHILTYLILMRLYYYEITMIVYPFYKWGKGGTERETDLPKVSLPAATEGCGGQGRIRNLRV